MTALEPTQRTRRRRVVDVLRPTATPLFWVATAAFAGATLAGAATTDLTGGRQVTFVAMAVVISATTALCRRAPLAALVVMQAAGLVTAFVDPTSPQGTPLGSILAAYALGRRARTERDLQVGLAVATVLTVVNELVDALPASVGSTASVVGLLFLAPAALGRGVRDRERLREVTQLRAAREEAERMERAGQALLDERARIAGELHDVVAHALSAMVVQAGGARVLALEDPGTAEQAFAAVERTGRDALFEIRSLVGVLREDDEVADREPQPSLEHLPGLISRVRRAGLPTTLAVEGEERPLPSGVSLAGYRAVQDALRAARDEGEAGRAEVVVRYEPAALLLSVADDGPGRRGPLAVRERVALYGGELADEAAPEGHRVVVRLPVGVPA